MMQEKWGGEKLSKETIGNSILGSGPASTGMTQKKRKELELRVKEELDKEKQKDQEDENEKLPKLTIPEPKAGDADWDRMVHVSQHYRKKPKKKDTETAE